MHTSDIEETPTNFGAHFRKFGAAYVGLSILVLVLVFNFIKAIWTGGDWLSIASIVVLLAAWVAGSLVSMAMRDKELFNTRPILYVLYGVSLLLLGSICVIGPGLGGEWVNTRTGKTTVGNTFLLVVPFSENLVRIPSNFSQGIDNIEVRSADGVPFRCDVYADGVRLDYRDPAKLEEAILWQAGISNDRYSLAGTVTWFIKGQAMRTLEASTSKELEQWPGPSAVLYQLQQEIGVWLAPLSIRWQRGEISYSCNLSRYSN